MILNTRQHTLLQEEVSERWITDRMLSVHHIIMTKATTGAEVVQNALHGIENVHKVSLDLRQDMIAAAPAAAQARATYRSGLM